MLQTEDFFTKKVYTIPILESTVVHFGHPFMDLPWFQVEVLDVQRFGVVTNFVVRIILFRVTLIALIRIFFFRVIFVALKDKMPEARPCANAVVAECCVDFGEVMKVVLVNVA